MLLMESAVRKAANITNLGGKCFAWQPVKNWYQISLPQEYKQVMQYHPKSAIIAEFTPGDDENSIRHSLRNAHRNQFKIIRPCRYGVKEAILSQTGRFSNKEICAITRAGSELVSYWIGTLRKEGLIKREAGSKRSYIVCEGVTVASVVKPTTEDAVYEFVKTKTYVITKDIEVKFGIGNTTAYTILRRLCEKGLVYREEMRPVKYFASSTEWSMAA